MLSYVNKVENFLAVTCTQNLKQKQKNFFQAHQKSDKIMYVHNITCLIMLNNNKHK